MRALPAILLIILVGCRPPQPRDQGAADTDSGVRVRLEAPADPSVGEAVVRVYLLSEDNAAITEAEVTVTGTMTHAGMEPVISTAPESEDGLYATEDFAFSMAGDWVLTADVTLPDGSEVSSDLPLTVTEN